MTSAPDDIAVRTLTGELSYARLDGWSNAIAAELLGRLGVRAEPVPFLLSQGPLAIAATVGILKAGKHYVPLDPSWGLERIVDLVNRLGARVIVTDAEFAASVRDPLGEGLVLELSPECKTATAPRVEIAPDQAAYIYFTSGSTGRPKGVIDCHRNVLHNVMRYTNALSIARTDRLSLLQSCGFSGAVSSTFAALLNGAICCPVDIRAETPASLAKWLDELGVTIYHSVPSIFRGVMAAGQMFHEVRVVRLEGDRATRLDLELFRGHFAPTAVLAIGLGATETGLVCQYFFDHESAMPEAVVPIGYPVEDMAFEIRGEDRKPVPQGTAGEIVVKSRFLATGYWNDGLATARAFEDVGTGERAYRSGDLGRISGDGCLEYLGRLNGLTRIRGQSVELADVEIALCALPCVREAAVTVIGEGTGHPRLIGYYVPRSGSSVTVSELRQQLAGRLPSHMVPARFVELERLPLNGNGKIDRAALPVPAPVRPNLASALVEPASLVQLRLCELWEELLDVAPIGIHDDFFDLGGDSLLAMTMLSRVEEIFGRVISSSVLLGGPDIAQLAAAVVTSSPAMDAPVVAIRPGGNRPPFFFLHGDYLSGGFYCRELARRLSPQQPFFALPPCGVDGKPVPASYRAMAKQQMDAIRSIQPRGPYLLGGECNGGLVAYEIACLLEAGGERVGLLTLLSASAANVARRNSIAPENDGADGPGLDPGVRTPQGHFAQIREIYLRIDRSYLPSRFGGRATLIWGRGESLDAHMERGWWSTVAAEVETFAIPGDHRTKLTRHVALLAELLDQLLERTWNGSVNGG